MSQRITPYWIGSAAHLPLPPQLSTGPNDTASQHDSKPIQKSLAKVLPQTAPKKKRDAARP